MRKSSLGSCWGVELMAEATAQVGSLEVRSLWLFFRSLLSAFPAVEGSGGEVLRETAHLQTLSICLINSDAFPRFEAVNLDHEQYVYSLKIRIGPLF